MSRATLVLTAYYGVLGLLAVYGFHRLLLVFEFLRANSAAAVPAPVGCRPTVTVQLPVYNEKYVVERLIAAVVALDYPAERLEIQVLDDSDDDTSTLVRRVVERARARGFDIAQLRREDRVGYKAGALEAGLGRARGEFVCVFDADFVPPRDFLLRTLPHFAAPDVGMVQVRWGHLNRSGSFLTRVQALFLDAHFAVEHAARAARGWFFNFNGTAGVWRRAAIVAAGGWHHDTLTEDLDLSYRAQLAGWRFVYIDDVVVPAELPATIAAFRGQQRRWTRGSIQTARKLLGPLWRSPAPWRTKVEATVHLTGNTAYTLMVMLGVLAVPAMMERMRSPSPMLPVLDVLILAFGTGSVAVFFAVGQRAIGRSWSSALLTLPALMALGAGIALNNALAVVVGAFGPVGEFVRTPKGAGESGAPGLTDCRPYRATIGWLPFVEAGAAAYFALAVLGAVQAGMWASVPILALFLGGTTYVAALSWSYWWRVAASQRAPR